jgi:hypothetical protein
LVYLHLYVNSLTGTIPEGIGSMGSLVEIFLYTNDLSGSIPSSIGSLSKMINLQVQYNHFTGSVPPSLGNLSALNDLYLFDNHFEGTLPSSLGSLMNLEHMMLNDNRFKGRIPSSFSSLSKLQLLYLQANRLSGHLEFFSQKNWTSLVNIDLSDNQLEGSIPGELFTMFPQLETVALSSNCFGGELPRDMCAAKNVVVFSMDGLGAARECSPGFIPFTGVSIGQTLTGSLPDCIWNLSKVEVLSLAGNGLSGTVGTFPRQASIVNLSLAHNYLSGTIPSQIQSWPFQLLDLSYNRLTGECTHLTVPADFGKRKSTVTLEVNRLSGGLPSTLDANRHLNILNGNMFRCPDLPAHDAHVTTYTCGSRDLDDAMYVLTVLCGVLAVMVGGAAWAMGYFHCITGCDEMVGRLKRFWFRFQQYWSAPTLLCSGKNEEGRARWPHSKHFVSQLNSTVRLCASLGGFGLLCCLPVYILKGVDYGDSADNYATHTHMYRWILSLAFVSGQLPAGLLLLAWALMVTMFVVIMWQIDIAPQKDTTNRPSRESSGLIENRQHVMEEPYLKIKIAGFLMLNVCVVGAMNGLYVYSTLRELSTLAHTCIQLGMAVFKYVWTYFMIPALVSRHVHASVNGVFLLLCVGLLNSILLPGLATLASSPSCLQVLASNQCRCMCVIVLPDLQSYNHVCNLTINLCPLTITEFAGRT